MQGDERLCFCLLVFDAIQCGRCAAWCHKNVLSTCRWRLSLHILLASLSDYIVLKRKDLKHECFEDIVLLCLYVFPSVVFLYKALIIMGEFSLHVVHCVEKL